jgi:hypothetical protein
MGGDAWGGHTACPGRPIVEQRGHIITRARELTEGANPKPPKPAHRPTTKKRYRRWMRWINYWHRK